ncbi:MAG TPA: acyl-CoA synthetase [Acidimicrobiia bacterium]|jgi:fatty-acyl-CoA synthase
MAGWNIATCWEAIADGTPERLALVQGDRRVTWREFDDRSARLATAFRELGLGPDSKVAMYLYNANEYLESTNAAFKLRAAHVNVNYRYLEDELAYLLDNSDAEVLVFHGSLADHVAKVRDRLPKLRAVVQVDDGSGLLDGALAYEELVAGNEPLERIERTGDELYILYTGGTTGMPKGVMWRNEDLYFALLPAILALTGAAAPDAPDGHRDLARHFVDSGLAPVHLPASPLMHGTGFMSSVQSSLLGGTIVTLESRRFDPDELWRTVEREQVSQMAIVGDAFAKPMLRALEEAEARGEPYDLSSMRLMISSGVMWSTPVKQGLMERGSFVCLDSLGSSEGVGFAGSISAPGRAVETAKFTIGESTKVLTEDGREVTPGSGEIGLLSLTGPLPLGYYKDPEKSAATFRTFDGVRYSIPGDWARVAADGTVELLGRGSVSINTGGEKVFPEEVEEALKLHPAVGDALVVGVPDERFGEAITALVAPKPGEELDADDVAEVVRGHLAGFKQPRHVLVLDAVTRGPNGKADYAAGRRLAMERLGVGTG